MIFHGFKIMWNQKRKYGFIIFELFAIFLIIISTMLYMVDQVSNYLEGTGCDIQRVYCLDINYHEGEEARRHDHFEKIRQRIEQLEGVESASFSLYAAPHIMQASSWSFKYGETITSARIHYVDEGFRQVLNLQLAKGSWIGDFDGGSPSVVPAVINREMADKLFEEGEPLGRRIEGMDHQYRVIGVVRHFKTRDFVPSGPSIFIPVNHPATGVYASTDLLVRYEKGTHPQPREYAREVFSVLSRDQYKIARSMPLESMKEASNANRSGDMAFVGLLVGFLIFNLVLGLIGILGYNVNQRWSEIGIRRAVGATGSHVRGLIFFELLAMTLMAFVPAFLIIVQVPALELLPVEWSLFVKAMAAALLVILLLVFLSVFYPALQASKIPPALALKEE